MTASSYILWQLGVTPAANPPADRHDDCAEGQRQRMHIDGDAAGQIVLDAMGQGPALHQPVLQTTIGSDRAMPTTIRTKSPRAAAATASTLSRLIVTSATMMIQIASHIEAPRLSSDATP